MKRREREVILHGGHQERGALIDQVSVGGKGEAELEVGFGRDRIKAQNGQKGEVGAGGQVGGVDGPAGEGGPGVSGPGKLGV